MKHNIFNSFTQAKRKKKRIRVSIYISLFIINIQFLNKSHKLYLQNTLHIHSFLYVFTSPKESKNIGHLVVSDFFQPHGLKPSRQEYWSGYPFPSPGDVSNPGIKSALPALQADSLLSEPPEKPPTSPDYYFHCILVSSALLYSLHLSFPIHSPHRSIMTF